MAVHHYREPSVGSVGGTEELYTVTGGAALDPQNGLTQRRAACEAALWIYHHGQCMDSTNLCGCCIDTEDLSQGRGVYRCGDSC